MRTNRLLGALLALALIAPAEAADDTSPFLKAVQGGDLPTITALLQQHPDWLRVRLVDGEEAVHIAAAKGQTAVLTALLDRGVSVDEPAGSGDTPMFNAAAADKAEVVELLLSRGARAEEGLHAAAGNGYVDIVDLLLKHGVSIEARNEPGNTPLLTAVAANQGGHE